MYIKVELTEHERGQRIKKKFYSVSSCISWPLFNTKEFSKKRSREPSPKQLDISYTTENHTAEDIFFFKEVIMKVIEEIKNINTGKEEEFIADIGGEIKDIEHLKKCLTEGKY